MKTEDQPPQCPSCRLSGNVALSLSSETHREQGGEGHRQNRFSSLLSGAPGTGELRLSSGKLLFPRDELGGGASGKI